MSGATTHDWIGDTEKHRPVSTGAWFRQILGFWKGAFIFRDKHSDVLDEHMFDEFTEFPETELDMARVRAWTRDLQEANSRWMKCKRQKGFIDTGACMEEGEAVRKAHWKHQLLLEEAGCEAPLFRFAKCIQRAENRYYFCRDLESSFMKCAIDSGKLDILPTTPPELKRPERYTGVIWRDIAMYKRWIKRRNEFLDSHPNWFADDDIEVMDSKQLYRFISKNEEWTDTGDKKPFTTFAFPQRYREYVPQKDRVVDYKNPIYTKDYQGE